MIGDYHGATANDCARLTSAKRLFCGSFSCKVTKNLWNNLEKRDKWKTTSMSRNTSKVLFYVNGSKEKNVMAPSWGG